MKILVVGDFHGKFPENIKNIARSKDIELIISLGDYANADKIRKIIFKNWINKPWYEVVGKKRAKVMSKESFDSGLKILNQLNNLGKPVYLIWGNADFYKERGTTKKSSLIPGFYEDKIKELNNLNLIEKKMISLKEFNMAGFGGYVDSTEYIKNSIDKNKKEQKIRFRRYKHDELNLKNLFKGLKLKNNLIFAIHSPPLKVFDKVTFYKNSPMYGKHLGWKPYNDVIKKYSPKLVLCGHMHEHQGKQKVGKSLIVSVGHGEKGKAAIVDWPSLKVRFVR